MTFIQLVLVVTAGAAILFVVKNFKKGRLKFWQFVAWFLVWLALGLAAALPKTTELLARVVGVGRGVDVAVYLAIVGLIYAVFAVVLRQEKTEREITKIVRELALRDHHKL